MEKSKKNKRHAKLPLFLFLIGLILIVMPLTFFIVNPIQMLINFRLRLANGTLLHEVMLEEIEGPKLYYYLFNFTNAERFLSGDDGVLKVEEVGPFVYQEYRTFEDLKFNTETNTMQFTPKHRTEFIVEDSIGRPEDFFLVMPNVALLSAIHMLSKYPYFIGQILKLLISGMNLKAFPRISAYKYMWGNTEPLIAMVNSVVPGLIYYNSTGLLSRFYDIDAKYRLTVDTLDSNKFQVKTVKRFSISNEMNSTTAFENILSYNNTYEGVIFPTKMTPDMPINIYRYSICQTLPLQYNGIELMEYGSKAFVYVINNNVFKDKKLCVKKGCWPAGVLDISTCYYGFPLALSKGHFLDGDPKLYEKIEGLKPNKSLHDSKLIVDPNIGVILEAFTSVQLNLALGDMSLLKETRRLSDMIIPVTLTVLKHPRMREETKSILRLMYTTGPYLIIAIQVLGVILGTLLLGFSAKMMYWHREDAQHERLQRKKSSIKLQTPLLH